MRAALVLFLATLINAPALAQQPKDIRTQKDKPIAVMNLKSIRPDCGVGTINIPVIREAPKNGTIVMTIGTLDEAASGNCAARKVPVFVLIYKPTKDFVGTDNVTIDIPEDNKTTSLSYRLIVAAGDSL